jgi:MmyB-like transcription regulator ligand binding domain
MASVGSMIGGSHRSSQRTSLGELSTRSDKFRTRWASHNVRFHRTGFKDINHRIVGDLHLTFEAMDMPADPGLSLMLYSAEPG